MTIDPDPYRILGLARSAGADEIKRAYRRLAKINHPDAAGPSALPRFLAIQAAYEQLIGRPAANGRRPAASPPPARAWEADAGRAGATRRAYGGRRQTPPSGRPSAPPGRGESASQPSPPGGATGPTGGPATEPAAGRSSRAGRAGRAGAGQGTTGRTGRRRAAGQDTPGTDAPGTPPGTAPGDASKRSGRAKRNKATLGSTSYDGADGPFEPDWRGASWYGTTSGTYWTLNPKEYADPRKHGPEYQARARRATRSRAADPEATDRPGPDVDDDPAAMAGEPPAPDPAPRPTHTTSSWWESTAGAGAASTAEPAGSGPRARGTWWRPAGEADPPPPDLGRAAADIARAIGDDRIGGVRGRVARAIIGWLPIAFGIGWILGELTGCGRFAATCDGAAEPFALLLQAGVLALLLLVPLAATLATTATVALLAAAVVATLILSATGTAADEGSRRATLGAVLLIAWLAGLGIGVMRLLRSVSARGRPVS